MHELAIARALIELAEAAGRGAAGRITRLRCRVGVLRQVEAGLLAEAFAVARAGTRCGGAELRVEAAPLWARCSHCGRVFAVVAWCWDCPACGAEGVAEPGGDELELVSIEVEA